MSERGDAERRQHEDEVWRDIVANFGERADLPEPSGPTDSPVLEPAPASEEWQEPAWWSAEEHFVPPEPPPLPRPAPRRLVAWLGLFGAPTLALIFLILGINLPDLIGLGLLAWFIGGFGYLVATMRTTRPEDFGDDGAVV